MCKIFICQLIKRLGKNLPDENLCLMFKLLATRVKQIYKYLKYLAKGRMRADMEMAWNFRKTLFCL